jgi:sugar phosphate isomerase/epimerase
MYKNLNVESLGISGRQSELIELALTYGFKGFDIDIREFAKRAESRGIDQAKRYVNSAQINVGGFEAPIRWLADEAAFKADLARLGKVCEAAVSVNAKRCYVNVAPASDERPYKENFEFHQQRLRAVADALAPHQIQLGLGFSASAAAREGKAHEFIHTADDLLVLVNVIGAPNVGLLFDSWNWRVGGGTMEKLKELSVKHFVVVRLADLPADADPQSVSDEQRLLPGEGAGDSIAIFEHLNRLKYKGPVTPYPHASQFSGMTRDAIVQRTSDAFDEQWVAAGLIKPSKEPLTAEPIGAGMDMRA